MDFNVPKLVEVGAWYDWRDNYAYGKTGRGYRNPQDIEKIIIHHTVTPRTGNMKEDIDKLYTIHVKQNGWKGIGYNLVVTSETVTHRGIEYAKVVYVGDISSIRAHCTNAKGIDGFKQNRGNDIFVGISIIGDHTKEYPTDAMYRSLFYMIHELVNNERQRLPKIQSWFDDVRGHNYYDYTWCPGDFGKIRNAILNINSNIMPANEGMSAEHPAVIEAINLMRAITKKASETPLSPNTDPIDIITNVSKENLEAPTNKAETLLLLMRYHYNSRSIVKGEMDAFKKNIEDVIKKEIEGLDIVDDVKDEVFKAITQALSVDDKEQDLNK